MEIQKAALGIDGDTMSLSMPMSKIDKKNRTVSGWASLDNLDLQGDIVRKEASEQAFARFRGNIREMHQPIAVGRMVSYKPDTYYDPEGKAYNGIFVKVRVSEGAESTWLKVLDGTLQAFSIKGPIRDSETEFSKDAGKPVRIIKDYDLEELSLVDSGGNQYANVVSFEKMANGSTEVTGMIAEVEVENVFYCGAADCDGKGVAKTSKDDSTTCGFCAEPMENIGWIERTEGTEVAAKVADLVTKFRGSSDVASNTEDETSKEVETNMADEKTEEKTVVVEEVTEEKKVEEVAPTETEEAAKVDETEEVEKDIVNLITDLKETVEKSLTETAEAAQARHEELEKRVNKIQEVIDEKIAASDKRGEELAEKFNSLGKEIETLTKRLGSYEDTTAVKKSGDLGGSTEETLEKGNSGSSLWGGTFLGVKDL